MILNFNLHVIVNNPAHYYVSEFLQLLSTYTLTQLTKQPTHVKGNCLDLVITGVGCDEIHVKNVEVDFSFCTDHYPVTFTLQSLSTQNDRKLERIWFRN